MRSIDHLALSVVVRSIGRPTLDRALASIATQHPPPAEVVVVAASGRRHGPIRERVGATEVCAVRPEAPLSRAAAADAGMRAARAEWITYLDDDDEFLPGHLRGLMAAAAAGGTRAASGRALACFRNGRAEVWGQRFALAELYERNFVHLSALLFHKSLRECGIAFDPELSLHEDWDFVLQVAQHTKFADWPRASFLWHADTGTSGGGGGSNVDVEAFRRHRDRVYAKWAPARDRWVERCTAALQRAASCIAAGRDDDAAAEAREVLEFSQNDPHALNVLAMLAMRKGNASEALALETLAIDVRPHDADLRVNLARVHVARGDRDGARAALSEALALNPSHAEAATLMRTLATATSSAARRGGDAARAGFLELERQCAAECGDAAAWRRMLAQFIELGCPDDLPGASAPLPPGDRAPRIAVITPYAREPIETLERCHRSVLQQTLRCEQIFVADGHARDEVDAWDARHVRLPVPSGDCGDTPRRIAGQVVIDGGFEAVLYLDADNWLRPRHAESLWARHRASGAALCHSARTLHRRDGTVMPLALAGDNVHHVDTSCLFVASAAFDLLTRWGTWPAALSRIDDRVFWHLARSRGHATAFTGGLTTCYEATHLRFYRTLGEASPVGTRPDVDVASLFTWYEALSPVERADLDARLGINVGDLLASLCPATRTR